MYMSIIPVYSVQWTTTNDTGAVVRHTLRVSEAELDAFLRVLTFNNVESFNVIKEQL